MISTSDAGEEVEEAGISPAKDSFCLWDPSAKSLFDPAALIHNATQPHVAVVLVSGTLSRKLEGGSASLMGVLCVGWFKVTTELLCDDSFHLV